MQAKPAATALPHPRHLDTHRPKPGLDLALWQVAIPNDGLATLGIMAVRILGEQHGNFRLYRLRQEARRALA